jgi:hypothetical protein
MENSEFNTKIKELSLLINKTYELTLENYNILHKLIN